MSGNCSCHIAYKCSSCGHCYAHDHSKFSVPASTPSGEQWYWSCPGGGIKPCFPDTGKPEPATGPIPQSKSQVKRFQIQQKKGNKKRR